MERGRTRDSILVVGVKESCSGQGNISLSQKPVGWTWWCAAAWSLNSDSVPEHCPAAQLTQSLNIALVLCNDRMSKIKNASFYRMDFLKRPPLSMLPLEATLVSMVCCPGLCGSPRFLGKSVALQQPGSMLMSLTSYK